MVVVVIENVEVAEDVAMVEIVAEDVVTTNQEEKEEALEEAMTVLVTEVTDAEVAIVVLKDLVVLTEINQNLKPLTLDQHALDVKSNNTY